MKTQIGGIVDMVTDPIETARGIYELAMSFIDDPRATAIAVGQAIGKDLSTLVDCGSYDRGRLLGENVSPAFMLRVATKLARFGRAGLGRALNDTRRNASPPRSAARSTRTASSSPSTTLFASPTSIRSGCRAGDGPRRRKSRRTM